MITFDRHKTQIVLVYSSERFDSAAWIDEKLRSDGMATLSRTFTVRQADAVDPDDRDEDSESVRRFVIGNIDGEYRTIQKEVLGLKHDLLISTSVTLRHRLFVAERDISIFRRIDELIDEPIIVGGSRKGAIPEEDFTRLLREFPTSTELTHYARARVTRVLREHFETMSDAETRLAAYMERRKRSLSHRRVESSGRIPAATALELEKFVYVRDRMVEMLKDAEAYSESEWQHEVADLLLLVYPQYVTVLQNVHVAERYSNESRSTNRYIDLVLVGADGSLDIVEIKKPFQRGLMSRSQYRDNHVPVRELSGSIMQAEKYLFYLSKSGRDGEVSIQRKHAEHLPADLEIKITNPKAIVLTGRDDKLSARERFDFEFVRRNYSNVVDIISYDDLLRRVERMIKSLAVRLDGELGRSALRRSQGASLQRLPGAMPIRVRRVAGTPVGKHLRGSFR